MATVALTCIETVADLAALEGAGAALVLGYHRPGDGGGPVSDLSRFEPCTVFDLLFTI